jgi:hypothetical protein
MKSSSWCLPTKYIKKTFSKVFQLLGKRESCKKERFVNILEDTPVTARDEADT